jgi:hypothetical protein
LAPGAGPGRRSAHEIVERIQGSAARNAASAVVATGPRGIAQPGKVGGTERRTRRVRRIESCRRG